jgi:hypothetical protein
VVAFAEIHSSARTNTSTDPFSLIMNLESKLLVSPLPLPNFNQTICTFLARRAMGFVGYANDLLDIQLNRGKSRFAFLSFKMLITFRNDIILHIQFQDPNTSGTDAPSPEPSIFRGRTQHRSFRIYAYTQPWTGSKSTSAQDLRRCL